MKKIVSLLVFITVHFIGFTTTWDEPWQKEIIEKADFFVFGKVISASDTLVSIEVEKSFGSNVIGTIIVDDFFLLDLCSASGDHGPEFSFEEGEKTYLFLKKGKNGNYQIPTPSSGFDRIVEGKVYATYRHTYHQAAMPIDLYELTYKAIWNKYHSTSYDESEILTFINENLKVDPAGFTEDEIDLFFRQHASIETAYLLDIKLEFDVLKKFSDCDNFHSRVSAIRAMSHINNAESKTYLLAYLKEESQDDFTKVIAIWSLWKMKDKKVKKELWEMRGELSAEETGFGGNIMDSRVCTYFPSPKEAVIELKEYNHIRKKIKSI